jgi:uncharacterized protein with FMN-binding domain
MDHELSAAPRAHIDREGLNGHARALGLGAAALGLSVLLLDCPAAGILPRSAYLAGVDTSAPSISSLPDGTYTARATVDVPLGSFAAEPYAEAEVTIANHRYAAIRMTEPKSFPGGVARFDDLAARVVAAQSTEVDVVSGATFTSEAFLEAVAKAVAKGVSP